MSIGFGTFAVFSLTILLSVPGTLFAQAKKPSTLAELVAYTGADREQILSAGAKSEGKVTWYTSLAGSSYKELAQGFEMENPTRERVHRHLMDREVTTLRRIEANVRAIEKKRKAAGQD